MSTDAEQARREKAEAWAKSKLPRLIEYQNEQDGGNYGMADAWNADDVAAEMEDAYLAGQECGEKREREAIGQELLDLLARKGKYKGSTRDRISEVFAMQARLRGEHRGDE